MMKAAARGGGCFPLSEGRSRKTEDETVPAGKDEERSEAPSEDFEVWRPDVRADAAPHVKAFR